MLYNITNKTYNNQDVNFIDGSSKRVKPGDSIEVNEFDVYKEEFQRIGQFFKIEQVDFDKIPRRITNEVDISEEIPEVELTDAFVESLDKIIEVESEQEDTDLIEEEN